MKQSVDQKIDSLANLVEKLLTRKAAPIAPVAPVAPVAPILSTSADDHVAIATLTVSVAALDTKVTEKFLDIKNDIKAISDGTAAQLADHETRLRTTEEFRQGLTGKLSLIAGAISLAMVIIARWIGKQFGF